MFRVQARAGQMIQIFCGSEWERDEILWEWVKVDHKTAGRRKIKVTCSSTCSLSGNFNYHWYRNGEYKTHTDVAYTVLDSTNSSHEGSYYCGMYDSSDKWHLSHSVCVLGKECWGVTYTPERVCALKGSSVDLSCSYKHPGGHTVTRSVWFIKEQAGAEPVDVREDEEYQGRVQYRQSFQNDCSMRITHLRERDAQTYRYRFYTDGGEYTGEPGVTLSVTDLEVTVSEMHQGRKVLRCSSNCTLPHNPAYIWYKNGQPVSNQYSNELYLTDRTVEAGSYSCAVRGHEKLRSPAVCVFDQNSCWSVSYSTQNICALIGSSVDIHGYYTFPGEQLDPQPAWYKELSPADGRVEFFSNRVNMNTLRMKHLRESDSAEYLLRFKAPYWNHTHSSAGVSLSVTGLQVKVEPVPVTVSEEQTVTLMCSSTCTLPNNPTYIWYKNRQPVIHSKSASCSVAVVSGVVSYSCAVEGHESLLSPPVYSPRNTSAVIIPSGERVEGDSVTLSCSSDANPPVLTYSWFKQRAAADAPLTTGQNYTITNISSQHSGLYYCTAHNQLGLHSSTPTSLDVLHSAELWKLNAVWGAVATVLVLAVSLLTAVLCIKRKRGAERDSDIQTPDPADHTYTALNPTTMTSDYDTLQHLTDSPSDTYSTLNPETMSSDYDTLTAVHPHGEKRRAPEMKNENFYGDHNKPDTVLK
ncbi:B-cell receptor CD22-like [Colossoma macropomum]|uniref:B-cell receptor CD22-like n=1 Tax=Colossoma macropomum TaxID=42526 RepID=UPI0018653A75|nr:B-cell receptor CD22-like [Colossoma macropomum]